MEGYEDDPFEADEGQAANGNTSTSESAPQPVRYGNWSSISFDEIELGEQIGGGSVGVVHRGLYMGKDVALKTLFDNRCDEAVEQDYMNELHVLSQLRHPNIVHFYGACMVQPHLFFVMELCKRSLFELLHKCSRDVGTRARISMSLDIARSLHYLHSRDPPIIHRDVKSLNLLLAGEDGPVKLCDFGLVRTTVTAAGTPAYMAPELLQDRSFNKSVDVYAFGILVWEIFSRQVPFDGSEAAEIREAVVCGGRPKVPRGCLPDIQRLMCRCWSGDPTLRPSFHESEESLQALMRATQMRPASSEVGTD